MPNTGSPTSPAKRRRSARCNLFWKNEVLYVALYPHIRGRTQTRHDPPRSQAELQCHKGVPTRTPGHSSRNSIAWLQHQRLSPHLGPDANAALPAPGAQEILAGFSVRPGSRSFWREQCETPLPSFPTTSWQDLWSDYGPFLWLKGDAFKSPGTLNSLPSPGNREE